MTINKSWLDTVKHLLNQGNETSPRGMKIKEIIGWQTVVDMNYPILSVKERKLGYKFMPAEAAWILSGDDRVQTIKDYSKQISRFSDDGKKFFGAYGPKIINQINYVVDKLAQDQDSRQALINIWRENPGQTNDVPCTISAQWLIREGKLICIDTMRSSDIWLGWPYDIFNFSMISGYIALKLREEYGIKVELGHIVLNAGSQHLYEQYWELANNCLLDNEVYEAEKFDIGEFDNQHDLVSFLWNMAKGVPTSKKFMQRIKK